jgi:hypothetical protein
MEISSKSMAWNETIALTFNKTGIHYEQAGYKMATAVSKF